MDFREGHPHGGDGPQAVQNFTFLDNVSCSDAGTARCDGRAANIRCGARAANIVHDSIVLAGPSPATPPCSPSGRLRHGHTKWCARDVDAHLAAASRSWGQCGWRRARMAGPHGGEGGPCCRPRAGWQACNFHSMPLASPRAE